MKKVFIGLSLVFFLIPFYVSSQIPSGYYSSADGKTGSQLKAALHNIIKGHTSYGYGSLWDILSDSDEDPNNHNNVILIYTGISRSKSSHGGSQGDWNREHVWAKSHGGFGTTAPAGTDAHHIRPADVQVNSLRGHLDFDMGGSPVSGAPGCYKDDDSFEPRDAVKGDVARMILYMAVRYEGDNGEPDLEVVDYVNTYPQPKHGKLSTLLEWNAQDPPDDFERQRNDVIYYDYQHNRNPFIDHPEYVASIWGGPNSINDNPELNVEVYPNPATTSFTISCSDKSDYSYAFVSLTGNVIKEDVLKSGDNNIDVSMLPKGIYFLRIFNYDKNYFHTYKIVHN